MWKIKFWLLNATILIEMRVKYSRSRHNVKKTSFTSPTGVRRQCGEQQHAQFCSNHDITSGWSCRRPENRELKMETFSGQRQLQPDVTSWFLHYCACSCSPHCRRAPVGDVKLVCLALWREREYLLSFQSNKKTLNVSFKAIFNVHFDNLVSKEYFSIQRLIIFLLYE